MANTKTREFSKRSRKRNEDVNDLISTFKIFNEEKKVIFDKNKNKVIQENNFYYDKYEEVFTKKKIIVSACIIVALWIILSWIYSAVYSMPFIKAVFEFSDNYIFVGIITLIIFFAFKRKMSYNKNRDNKQKKGQGK